MVFTSWAFVAFFLVVLTAIRLAPTRASRQLVILLSSAFFYAYWNKFYLLLLATPSVIDYVCALLIENSNNPKVRKRILILSVCTNLGLLGYFKYTNFFLSTLAAVLGKKYQTLDILLPVGISFYTFKTLSYTIDVYRREIPACRDWWRYAMFVTYFPELVAGPIVRASVFLPQMTRSLKPSWSRARVGLQLVLLGVSKKLLIADRMAVFVDAVFDNPRLFSPATVACAVVAYSIQIYCDFSGYSDIAIGISRIIGFDLPENFNMPYIALSITEFWKRWHITLSQWLRDYLYIPLGGNRKGRLRTYVNLIITMLLGGLWHGASWTFVAWGLLHGAALAGHKFWLEETKHREIRIPKYISWAATYGFVCFSWIFFRAQSFSTANILIKKLLLIDRSGISYVYLPFVLVVPLLVGAHYIGHVVEKLAQAGGYPRYLAAPQWARRFYRFTHNRFAMKPHVASGYYIFLPRATVVGTAIATLWIFVLYFFATVNSSPFIYFQF